MFAPYCDGHCSRVLLPMSAITALEHSEEGLRARFICTCGREGVWQS